MSCNCGSWACEVCFPTETDEWSEEVAKEVVKEIAKVEEIEEDGWTKISTSKKLKKPKVDTNMIINCSFCNSDFTFTVYQQNVYKVNGWEYPKRCKDCKNLQKKSQQQKIVC